MKNREIDGDIATKERKRDREVGSNNKEMNGGCWMLKR